MRAVLRPRGGSARTRRDRDPARRHRARLARGDPPRRAPGRRSGARARFRVTRRAPAARDPHHRHHGRAQGGAARLAGARPDRGQGPAPSPTSAGCWPTGRISSPGSRSCCTSWPARRPSWRPFRASPRTGSTPSSPTTSPASAPRPPSGASCSPRPAAVRPDSPACEQITLGGEASPADLLDELRTTFPFARVSQVYASTEFGSITSVNDGMPGIAIGSLWSATNPTSNVRAENGELWVRAEAGMLGYADEADGPAASTHRVATDRRPRRDRRHACAVPGQAVGDHQRGRRQGPPPADRGTDPGVVRRRRGPRLRTPEQADRRHRGGRHRAHGRDGGGGRRRAPASREGRGGRPAPGLATPQHQPGRRARDPGWQDSQGDRQ